MIFFQNGYYLTYRVEIWAYVLELAGFLPHFLMVQEPMPLNKNQLYGYFHEDRM